ncbi:amino acid permease [uncultured Rhodoblastus sp.]|uniref:amino acid permease n=1 Tax=uncultured Rhodoblastus sp. TaxID=543037 RepID=UPI0025CF07CF|nr:amino acid permease [uncultured Rhodoblastus sp.]
MSAQVVPSFEEGRGTAAPRVHPRTIGWVGTAALAMGGSNQSLFLMAALFGGQGDIPGQGSASIILLAVGLLLGFAAAPGWIELVLMSPNRVGGIAAACTAAFEPYGAILSALTGVCYWWGWVPTCGLTALFSASAINQWALPDVPVPAIACFLVALFVAVNLAGIKWVTRVSVPIATVSAALAFVSMIAPVLAGRADWTSLGRFHLDTPFPGWFGDVTSLMAGLYLVGFAAPAFEAATCHVAETIDQNRNVPRAVLAAAFMAAIFFVGLPIVWFCVLGAEPLTGDLGQVLGPTFQPLFGGLAKSAAIWFMMFNMFHGTMQPLAGAARTLSQLSDDGLLPRFLALRSKNDAPWAATILTAAFSILFLLMGDPIWLVAAANFTYLIGICLPNIAVWLLRRNAPGEARPWRAPRGTIGLGVAAALVWLTSTVLGFEQFGLPTVVFGLAMAYSGAGLFAWRKMEDRVRAGLPAVRMTLHLKLTGAMLLVLVLDAGGYLIAVNSIPAGQPAMVAALEDIFVAVAILTITVGVVLPGMIAHSAAEISAAAQRLSSGVLHDFSSAMNSLAKGDLAGAHLEANIFPVVVRSQDELGTMAESFNEMQFEVKKAARGIDGAREGLRGARAELTESNEHLREEVRKQEKLAAELILARDAAEAGNRSKAEFLAIISHELRTPLNGVIGLAGLLLDADLDDRSRRYVETLNEAGDHLLQLINDLLDFSKLEANQFVFEEVVFDLDSVLLSVLDLIGARARAKGLKLSKHMSDQCPPVLIGDPGRLRQVLSNLLGNAVKFTEKGAVSVEVRRLPSSDAEALLEFAITDTGIGIASDKLPLLFREFSQIDSSISRRFGGTGLGLAISRRLVTRMGGTIRAESRLGQGSTFRFTSRFKLAKAPLESVDESPMRLDGRRILIVDTCEANQKIAAQQVSDRGATVVALSDPRETLARLRLATSNGAPFDAVVINRNLPDFDGNSLAREIRAGYDFAGLRLILASSGELDFDQHVLMEGSFDAILANPVSANGLVRVLGGGEKKRAPPEKTGTGIIASSARKAGKAKIRVLVAEDNQTNQLVIRALLEKAGVRVDLVANGLEAVSAVRERPYDLVLMDVMMPELDGVSATRQIRALPGAQGRIPIIGLTANVSEEDHAAFRAAGMDRVITKPVRYQQLEELLSAGRWGGSRGSAEPE